MLFRSSDGTLWGWGSNPYGNLGTNNITSYSSPVQVGTSSWSSVSAGGGTNVLFTMAIRSDGTLWGWGRNTNGNLGTNNITNYSSPVQVGTSSWSSVSAGGSHTMAIRSDGTLWGWGYNGQGQLGLKIGRAHV